MDSIIEERLDLSSPDLDMFSALKKKKKKRKKIIEPSTTSSVTKIKKNKKAVDLTWIPDEERQWNVDAIIPEIDYSYDDLCDRLYSTLYKNHPNLKGKSKSFKITNPDVKREGSKKTAICNFKKVVEDLNRPVDHVMEYIIAELVCNGTIVGDKLILRQRFRENAIIKVIRSYIQKYVICNGCKSNNTTLIKEKRNTFIECNVCFSRKSVSKVERGYEALSRGGRRVKT